MSDSLATRIARWLAADWDEDVEVVAISESTAGARRQNLLLDVLRSGRPLALVATIVPPELDTRLDVRSEAAVRALAGGSSVPVPAVRSTCADPGPLGAPFFVSDRVTGETVPRRVHRLAHEHGIGPLIVEQLGTALAHLHAVDPVEAGRALAEDPQADESKRPIAHALRLCRARLDALTEPEPALSFVYRWLVDRTPPEPEHCTLVHTDARVGNLVVGTDGLRALLDWEGARLGDPMEDVAWPCTRMWRFGNDAATVGGLADLGGFRASYLAAGGRWDDLRFGWWRMCGGLQWALELDAQAQGYLAGTTRSIVMAASGRRLPELAHDLLQLAGTLP